MPASSAAKSAVKLTPRQRLHFCCSTRSQLDRIIAPASRDESRSIRLTAFPNGTVEINRFDQNEHSEPFDNCSQLNCQHVHGNTYRGSRVQPRGAVYWQCLGKSHIAKLPTDRADLSLTSSKRRRHGYSLMMKPRNALGRILRKNCKCDHSQSNSAIKV